MLSVILAAVVATASGPPTAAAPVKTAAQEADPLVCHQEPIQGSRITHKVCIRVSEAAQLRRDARWLLDRAQSGATAPNMANMVAMGPMH